MTPKTTIHPTANALDQTKSSGVQRGVVMPVALTLLTIFSAGTAQAVDLYWDGTTIAGDADGGTGTWDNGTTSNWDDAASAGTDTTWNNATPDSAIFGGTAGTVTLGEAITADSLQFDTTGYTVTGSTLTLSGSSTITANEDATIGSTLAGTSGLTKEGTGTLTLQPTGAADVAPTGTRTINGGTLEIDLTSASSDRQFGGAGNDWVINGVGSSVLISDTIGGNARHGFNVSQWTFGSSGGGTVTINGINPIARNVTITTTGGVTNTFGGDARLNGQGSTTQPVTFDVAAGTDPSGVDLEFSGDAGNLKLVKAGDGVMSITSGANSINVGIDINAGTLELAGSGRLNSGSYSSAIDINGASSIFRHSGAGQTLSGNITGTGSLEKIDGSGALTLSGNSTYSGTTTVGDGVGTDDSLLFAGSTTGFSSNSAFTVNSDAIVLLNDFSNEIGSLAGSGVVRNANSGTTAATLTTGGDDTSTTFSGTLQDGAGGALSLTKTGSGTQTLTGSASYTGATTINAGTLQLGDGTTGNDGTIAGTSIVNNADLTYNRFGTASYGGVISGSGTVTKEGAGTQALTGANTYSGATTITTGTLQLGDGTDGNDGTIAGTSIVNNADLTYNRFGTASYGGVISGSGTVTKEGTGTQTLTGANTYTGATTITAGTLEIGSAGQLGSGTYAGTIANDGILNYNSSATQTLNGVISGSGSLVLNGSGQLNLSVNNSFSGGVTVNNGTLGLEFSAIDGGPLTVNGGLVSGSIHDSYDNISVSELSGSGGLIEAARRTFTVTQATNTTYAGVIQDLNGIVSSGNGTVFTKAGSGTLTLTGDNTYSKTTNVNGGTLEVSGGLYSAGTNVGGSSNINIGAAGTLDVTGAGSLGLNSDFDGTITNDGTFKYNSSADQTLSGVISGSSALTQSGAGTLTLSGANTYTGATTVSAGILLINNTTGSGTGTGAVTVASGASLGGSGTISGATTIQSGGFLAPGNSPGILTFSGDLTLASGSFTNMEITGSTRGTDYDGIDVGGALTYGGTLTLTSNTLIGVGEYNLFDFTSESGDFSSITLSGTAYANNTFTQDGDVWDAIVDNQTYTYSQVTGNLVVATAAVPEPETFALLGGLLALTYVLGRRRRR